VLVAINDQPVTSLAEAKILLNRTTGSAVTLTVRTGNFPLRRVTVVPATDTRQVLDTIGLSGETSARVQLAANVLFAIICTSIALVIAWKKWNDWFALLVSMTIVVVLLGASLPVILFYQANASWQAVLNIWFMFAFTLLLGFFYLFPTSQFVPRQTRWLLAALAVWTVIGILNPALYPWQISSLLYALVLVGGIGTGIFAQATRYRSLASTEEKQQIRWVVFGAAAAALGIVLQILPRTIGLNLTGAWDVLYGRVLCVGCEFAWRALSNDKQFVCFAPHDRNHRRRVSAAARTLAARRESFDVRAARRTVCRRDAIGQTRRGDARARCDAARVGRNHRASFETAVRGN
jgi:hypothetical protein